MIEFIKDGKQLILGYQPDVGNEGWLDTFLKRSKGKSISGGAFIVSKRSHLPDQSTGDDYRFLIGKLEDDYYRVDKDFLGISYNLFIHSAIELERSTFVAHRNISIFGVFNDFELDDLYIGGKRPDALPTEAFEALLKKFPNSYELDRYAEARVSAILRNYRPVQTDFEAKYRKYMKKRASMHGSQPRAALASYEADKFSDLVLKIEDMLSGADSYTEDQWQDEILQVVLFLYPRYLRAFPEAPVRDSLAKKDRSIDFLLVDASGYVDAIEIKKPFDNSVVSSNRYRDNHVPMRELSGTVMQLEKYLYHLNRWGERGEEKLNSKYMSELPSGVQLKIVNPGGIIIMGRHKGLSGDQQTDFEIIRRKYRHVLDIMTYDDLLRRLKTIRDQFKKASRGVVLPKHIVLK